MSVERMRYHDGWGLDRVEGVGDDRTGVVYQLWRKPDGWCSAWSLWEDGEEIDGSFLGLAEGTLEDAMAYWPGEVKAQFLAAIMSTSPAIHDNDELRTDEGLHVGSMVVWHREEDDVIVVWDTALDPEMDRPLERARRGA